MRSDHVKQLSYVTMAFNLWLIFCLIRFPFHIYLFIMSLPINTTLKEEQVVLLVWCHWVLNETRTARPTIEIHISCLIYSYLIIRECRYCYSIIISRTSVHAPIIVLILFRFGIVTILTIFQLVSIPILSHLHVTN